MNSSIGLFLPTAGYRNDNRGGSGTEATTNPDTEGYYQSRDDAGGTVSYFMLLRNGTAEIQAYQKKDGKTVRCVKGD